MTHLKDNYNNENAVKVEYLGEGEVIAPQGEKGFHETFIIAKPTLEKDGKEKHIRIVVSGIIMENSTKTNKAVSAYLDVLLKP